MKILHVGDICGSPGRAAFARVAGALKNKGEVDFVVANAENSAGGRGITPEIADQLFAAGADVITLGDHTWDQKEILKHLDLEPRLVRPANFAPGCPGRGYATVETPHGKISVMMLIGRVFMPPFDCPFRAADAILQRGGSLGSVILVEMHAEATSEKKAMGYHLDGRVTSVVGTHTHVQTSDERILPRGTAYLTDLGMTGPSDSVIGMNRETVMPRFLTGMPTKFEVGKGDVVLEGALITVDPRTGRASKIKRVRERVD
jgi:hypothetical protein